MTITKLTRAQHIENAAGTMFKALIEARYYIETYGIEEGDDEDSPGRKALKVIEEALQAARRAAAIKA